MSTEPKTILFLAANPKGSTHLRLDQELRDIGEGLQRTKRRDQYQLVARWAVRAEDWRRALLDTNPQILHFSGHGKTDGLIVKDERGRARQISGEALADLFCLFEIECVVLNACYSSDQAEVIRPQVGCVVGMDKAIGDEAALAFAVGFYDALGAGRSYKAAYRFGCNAIQLLGIPEEQTPVFLGGDLGKAQVFMSYREVSPDRELALALGHKLEEWGHRVVLAEEDIKLGANWPERIDQALREADYFVVLVSEAAAISDFVTEQVRRAWELRQIRPRKRPVIVPIRVGVDRRHPLNYDLRSYLSEFQQWEWRSEEDTPRLIQDVLERIEGQQGDEETQERIPVEVRIETRESPPLPVAEPELPVGQVGVESPFYVVRDPDESECWREISKRGALIKIRAPRQMGKTSLLARLLAHAQGLGYRTIPLTLQQVDRETLTDLDRMLQWLCQRIGRRLGVDQDPRTNWGFFGSNDSCTNFFEDYLLPRIESPWVVGLDEADRLFEDARLAQDFFGMLRAWHEMGKSDPEWGKLRWVVVHSTEPYMLTDLTQSPFANVGLSVRLRQLSVDQVQDLIGRHGLTVTGAQRDRLQDLLAGHPYLVRVALYQVARGWMEWDQVFEVAALESGPYQDHLRRLLLILRQYPELKDAFRRVLAVDQGVRLDSIQAFLLDSLGLIRRVENDEVGVACELYRRYFRRYLKN